MDFILVILLSNNFESSLPNFFDPAVSSLCTEYAGVLRTWFQSYPFFFDVKLASDAVFIEAKEKGLFPEIYFCRVSSCAVFFIAASRKID